MKILTLHIQMGSLKSVLIGLGWGKNLTERLLLFNNIFYLGCPQEYLVKGTAGEDCLGKKRVKKEYTEGCLSFPGEIIKTTRYSNIVVRDTNNGTVVYEPKDAEHLLEIVCIQHEIDHLNGIVMHDRQVADIDLATII